MQSPGLNRLCISAEKYVGENDYLLFVDGTVGGTSAIVGTFLVHTEGIPCGGTEYLVVIDVVHTYRDAED